MSGPFKLRSGNTTPFKKMGSSPAKQESKTYKESKEEGRYTKEGRSHTKGPVVGSVWDVDPNKPKSSKKVGPAESPKVIAKEREEWRKAESTDPFSEKSEKEREEYIEKKEYVKR